jgi:hypothetical protein
MGRPDRLSNTTRLLTLLSGLTFLLLGTVLFTTPSWSAERFAWKVSPFVAMTIGAWCLGTAAMAWIAYRDLRWSSVHPVLLYLWSFAVLELGVLVWFRDSLRLDLPISWPYVGTLVLGLVAAGSGITDLIRHRPALPKEAPVPVWVRVLWLLFIPFVTFLVVQAVLKAKGAPGRGVFPEPLSAFTVRAFGAFYLSLVISGIPLFWARSTRAVTAIFWGGLALSLLILTATLVFFDRFDFGAHPLQLLYLGAYVGATAISLVVVLRSGARSERSISWAPQARTDHEGKIRLDTN